MRILSVGNMYPPHHLGGYELIWRSAVGEQRARGHEVRVLTTDYRSPREPDAPELDADVHRELRWYWHDHAFPRMSLRARLALERHNAAVLDRQLAELHPDVVAWWAMGGMSLSLIERVRRRGLPAVGVVGDEWMGYGPRVDAWMRLWRRWAMLAPTAARATRIPTRLDLDRAARWVFISEWLRRRVRERAGWSVPGSIVAHPGVDPARFAAAPAPPWRWRLAYVGRIDSRKGIDTAIRALALLPEDAVLTVDGAGDEAHACELAALAGTTGVAGRVTFEHSAHDAVPGAYAAADVIVFPVRWEEPWGLVPLEAMAVGRPVVASARGGAAEYLRDGENCLVIDPNDPTALGAAVARLAADSGLRDRLRAGGLATADSHRQGTFSAAVAAAHEAGVLGRDAADCDHHRADAAGIV